MHANDEMSIYLEDLIAHERACEVENCALCQSARNVYRLIRNLVFSEVVYPDATIAARAQTHEAATPVVAIEAFSTPRAA